MTLILLSNIWEVIELLFQENYKKLESTTDFKLMSVLNKKDKLKYLSIAIPYWTLFTTTDYIEYIEYMNINNKPYYDHDIECFIFKSANDMLTQLHDILNHVKNIFEDDEDVKYKAFVIDVVIKKNTTASSSSSENDLLFLLNNLRI
jgi:hypothetical protein